MAASDEVIFGSRYRFSGSEIALYYHGCSDYTYELLRTPCIVDLRIMYPDFSGRVHYCRCQRVVSGDTSYSRITTTTKPTACTSSIIIIALG